MKDEFGLGECPQCGAEVRIPIYGWTLKQRNAGITEYIADYGTPKCTKRCKLTKEEEEKIVVVDHAWEDW